MKTGRFWILQTNTENGFQVGAVRFTFISAHQVLTLSNQFKDLQNTDCEFEFRLKIPIFTTLLGSQSNFLILRSYSLVSSQHAWNASVEMVCLLVIQIEIEAVCYGSFGVCLQTSNIVGNFIYKRENLMLTWLTSFYAYLPQ